MIKIRKSEERGHANHGWLNTYHTFSFASYFDPEHIQFRDLRVINEDRVIPNKGFGRHPHQNMEIITYVLEGQLAHKDSMGNGSTIKYGDVQRMSAGTGVEHSEFNPSKQELVHFYQIWILPEENGLTPSYEQKHFTKDDKRGDWLLIASHDGEGDSVTIHQDVKVWTTILENESLTYNLDINRHAWVQVARGKIDLNGHSISAGDGAAISAETELTVKSDEESEIILFDLK